MAMAKKTRPKPFPLRLRPELRKQLEALARADHRNLTNYLLMVLERHVEAERIREAEETLQGILPEIGEVVAKQGGYLKRENGSDRGRGPSSVVQKARHAAGRSATRTSSARTGDRHLQL